MARPTDRVAIRMHKKFVMFGVAGICAVLLGLTVFVLQNLSDMAFSNARVSTLTFRSGGAQLVGTLALPPDVQAGPIVLIIHGDGPMDRFASDGYFPLINSLLDAGIGVFTWDKQGLGRARGIGSTSRCRTAPRKPWLHLPWCASKRAL